MFQVIPFKRESWQAEFTNPGFKKSDFDLQRLGLKLIGSYSSKRAKKSYK